MSAEKLIRSKTAERQRKKAITAYIMSEMAMQRMKYPALAQRLNDIGIHLEPADLGSRIRSGVMSGFLLTYILQALGQPDSMSRIIEFSERLESEAS